MSLESIRKRLVNATPGPWEWAADRGGPGYVQLYCPDEAVDEYEADVLSAEGNQVLVVETNAELIAHAPTDLALLVDVAEAAGELLMAEDAASCTPMEYAAQVTRRRLAAWKALVAALDRLEEAP